jgi:hypothetical protein
MILYMDCGDDRGRLMGKGFCSVVVYSVKVMVNVC